MQVDNVQTLALQQGNTRHSRPDMQTDRQTDRKTDRQTDSLRGFCDLTAVDVAATLAPYCSRHEVAPGCPCAA